MPLPLLVMSPYTLTEKDTDDVKVTPLLMVRFLQFKVAVMAVLLAMMASVLEVGAEGLQDVPFQVDCPLVTDIQTMHVNTMLRRRSFFMMFKIGCC